jgi:hypothetical protein
MGCDVRSELAVAVGAECDREGYVLVEKYKEFCATIMAM